MHRAVHELMCNLEPADDVEVEVVSTGAAAKDEGEHRNEGDERQHKIISSVARQKFLRSRQQVAELFTLHEQSDPPAAERSAVGYTGVQVAKETGSLRSSQIQRR